MGQLIQKELSRAKSTGRAQAGAMDSISPLGSCLKNSQNGINRNLNETFKTNDRIE